MSASGRSFYASVFLISLLLMCLQVIQSRIFSVTTWYHLSFLIISLAMFGLTAGALRVHNGVEAEQRRNYAQLMARAAQRFALAVIVALLAQLWLPVVWHTENNSVLLLPQIALLTIPPYYFAGVALSLAITRAPFPPALAYGADLAGGAAGCLAALGLMEMIDAPSALLAVSLCALCVPALLGVKTGRLVHYAAAVVAFFLAANLAAQKPVLYPLWVKGARLTQEELQLDSWNAISRVTIAQENKGVVPYLWGPSPKLPKSMKADWHELLIDGDAGTPVNPWNGDTGKALRYLDYDVSTIAYALPGLRKSAVIGLGGGRDVLSALHAGVKDVTGLDVNRVQVDVLTKIDPFKSYANLYNVPGVKLVHSEARSWLSSHPETFDLIQMSLVDTWASTGAGAFALSENGLYTVEAWNLFLSRLKAGGVMTVSRWFTRDAKVEGERLLSLSAATLIRRGAKDPQRHVFVATSGAIMTLVLARDPFTPQQLDALEKRTKEMDFHVLVSPRKIAGGNDGAIAAILSAKTAADLDRIADHSPYDIRPPLDTRPFFFSPLRVTDPATVFRLLEDTERGTHSGEAQAFANLYVIMAFSVALVCILILYPLRAALREKNRAFTVAGTAWFLLIGAGFMLIEISLLQRMSVYLGHPSYGLGIVLFSLILSTGLGSLLSSRYPLRTPAGRTAWALGAAATAAFCMPFLGHMMGVFSDADLPLRAAVCVSVTLPLGMLLGYGFPTGMAMAGKLNPRANAWFWGINGAAGVMAGSLALAFNIAWGLETTMMMGAACYALLAATGWRAGTV